MKAIMVPVADRPECAKALVSAFELAQRYSGNVIGYHMRPHHKESRRTVGRPGVTATADWNTSSSKRKIELDSKNAQRLFDRIADDYKFTLSRKAKFSESGGLALWRTTTGDPAHLFSIIGPLSDMIVVSRPKSKKSVKAHAFAYAALTHSGRPVLHLPQRKLTTIGKNVLIAWNQSEQSAAAVMASRSILAQAESVTIVSTKGKQHLGPSVKHLQSYLQLHGIDSSAIKLAGMSVEDEIVQTYADVNADLLVMGAYSRPKWRERIFGGVTTHILENTQLPTLTLHPSG